MPAKWRIDIRLGDNGDIPPLRTCVVDAETEADALTAVLAIVAPQVAAAQELLQDGEEEVTSRTEIELGQVDRPDAG